MTEYNDGFTMKVDWLDRREWNPDCSKCYHFEHTHCDNIESDHYGHNILPFHPACSHFEEKY